jgi:hypothetical protein
MSSITCTLSINLSTKSISLTDCTITNAVDVLTAFQVQNGLTEYVAGY